MRKREAVVVIKGYAREEDENKADRRTYARIAKLVEDGQYKKAFAAYQNADTFVRERFSEDVVAFLGIKAAGGARRIVAKVRLTGTKKVFNEKLGPGVVGSVVLEIAKNASDEDVAMAVLDAHNEILDKFVEVVLEENGEECGVLKLKKER